MANELAKGTAVPLVLRILSKGPQHGYGLRKPEAARAWALLKLAFKN